MLRGIIACLISLCLSIAALGAPLDTAQFRTDLSALCESPSRIVGSDGYFSAARYLESEIAKLPNVELKKHEFPVMVPVTQSATLDLGSGRVEKVYPFWPAAVRACSTPAEGITGKFVYAGECSYEQIKPASIKGQIAVVEASAKERWTDASYFGAKAILILGSPETSWADLQHHDLRIPVNLPRFYVPPGQLADDLRDGHFSDQATLRATVQWERKIARNYYALVRAPNRTPAGWASTIPPASLMFSVPFESSSLVPDLAPGASQAIQAACGLALLRDITAHPWDRSVVVFFEGADSLQALGTRNMFLALGESPAKWREQMGDLDESLSAANRDLARARQLQASPQALSISADRELCDRIVKIVETDLASELDELFRLRAQSTIDANQVKRLEDRQILLNRLKYGFQQNPSGLSDPILAPSAREYMARTNALLSSLARQFDVRKGELNLRIDLYQWLAGAVGRNPDPGKKQTDSRLIDLIVGLDLSDRGSRVGPMYFGYFQRASSMGQIQDFREWFSQQERAGVDWFKQISKTIDFSPLSQVRAPTTYLAAPMPIASELAAAFATPGFSMITLDDLRIRRDTPNDSLASVNVDAILPQLRAVRDLFAGACADPKFHGPAELKRLTNSFAGQVVSPSPGKPVPDLPREGFLATYYYIPVRSKDRKIPFLGGLPYTLGIRRNEVRDCDAEGNYRFEGLPQIRADKLDVQQAAQNDMQVFAVNVYRIDPKSGAITATTDLGKQAGDIKWSVDIKQEVLPLRSLVFDCEEYTLTGLYDPRFLQSLNEALPLDARRNAEPQRFGMWLGNQMLAGFVEPGTPLYLLIRYGRIGNRIILIDMPDSQDMPHKSVRGDGIGYTAQQFNNLGPIDFATSKDFYRLDDRRLTEYRRAGVSSSLVDSLHRDALENIEGARRAIERDDGTEFTRTATGAWADEARVYDAAQDMARDVIRAAIFLLILCVPFSFCMERLLIGTPNVYKQIIGAACIFATMATALWAFHPAFKISASPLIIILAFAIILMSSLVILVIYAKFDTELKRIRSERGSATGASIANAGVLMSAVLLGIANMRKRKFRTLLTSITIVLITFAVLCFTSTSRFVGTTSLPTGIASSYPGILLRQRGFRPMAPIVADQLRAVLGRTQVVQHWWAVSAAEPKEQYDLVGTASRVIPVQAILGLSPGESDISKIANVIGSSKFARLEKGEQNIVYLASGLAKDLSVKEDDTIRIGGIDLIVAGIFEATAFDHQVLSLAGEQITPLRYTTGAIDASGKRLEDSAAEALDLDAGASSAEAGGSYEHLSSSQVAIVPASICKMLLNSSLRRVAFRLRDESQVKSVSEQLTRRLALAMYAGYDDGVRMVSASNLSSVSGAGQVAIPLLIAGLIIFNTMMGSIAERKREIHVYTSLGLAPMHVGALFVAEAMTYGLIGTVFGYIIGQGVGTLMLKMGWLGSATLNYSGTSAMMTMGLILLIVFLSALVPARIASKIAAPSIDRTWKVPQPTNGQITAILPFTINETAADGALAYLAEYFDAHKEGSIGKFSAGDVEPIPLAQDSRGLKTTIWLTPLDLGVKQNFELVIHPGQFAGIWEVKVILQRLSGDDRSWHRMNKRFLTELRKQFLQWRSLSPTRMTEYVEQSRRLFSSAADARG